MVADNILQSLTECVSSSAQNYSCRVFCGVFRLFYCSKGTHCLDRQNDYLCAQRPISERWPGLPWLITSLIFRITG